MIDENHEAVDKNYCTIGTHQTIHAISDFPRHPRIIETDQAQNRCKYPYNCQGRKQGRNFFQPEKIIHQWSDKHKNGKPFPRPV